MSDHLANARVYLQLHQYSSAEFELRAHLQEYSSDGFALTLLTHCLIQRGEFREAVSFANIAIAVEPNLADGFLVLAQAQLGRTDVIKARKAIQIAIRLAPQCVTNYSVASAIEAYLQNWLKSLGFANQGLQFDPADVNCLEQKITALRELRRYSEASSTALFALERFPEHGFAQRMSAYCALDRGDLETAERHFNDALRLNASDRVARDGLVEARASRFAIYRWTGSVLQRVFPRANLFWWLVIGFSSPLYLVLYAVIDAWTPFGDMAFPFLTAAGMISMIWAIRPEFQFREAVKKLMILDPVARTAFDSLEAADARAYLGVLAVGVPFGLAAILVVGLLRQ